MNNNINPSNYLYTIVMQYPISVNRYYRTFRNITMISKEGRLFKQKVRQSCLDVAPSNDNVLLDIVIHPKQKKDGTAFSQIIDLDNGLKCILDSLIGIVYHDDKQVKGLHVNYGASIPNGATTVLVSKFI